MFELRDQTIVRETRGGTDRGCDRGCVAATVRDHGGRVDSDEQRTTDFGVVDSLCETP